MKKMNLKKGFTLMELLIVIAIVGVFAAIVVVALNDARDKGSDGAVKSNLANSRSIAEIFYNTNTAVPNSYIGLCTNGVVGGAQGIGLNMLAIAKAIGLTTYNINTVGVVSPPTITCKVNATGTAWAAEAPLKDGGMWCTDSTSASFQTNNTIGAGYTCN